MVLHFLRKDFLRFRWAWIILLVFGALRIVRFTTDIGLADSGFADSLALLTGFLAGCLCFFVIVMAVQEETLADPDAWWRTRPIPRLRLLLEKVLFCGILVAGYYCITDSLILLLNDGASLVPYALGDGFYVMTFVLAQIFLAAQTRSLPRYLLFVILLFLGLLVFQIVAGYLLVESEFDLYYGMLPANFPSHWIVWIQVVFWLSLLSATLVLYYKRQRRGLCWALLAAGFFVAMALLPSKEGLSDRWIGSDFEEQDIDVRPVEGTLRETGSASYNGEKALTYSADFEVDGLGRDQEIWFEPFSWEITGENGTTKSISDPGGFRGARRLYPKSSDGGTTRVQGKVLTLNVEEVRRSGNGVDIGIHGEFNVISPVLMGSIEPREGASFVKNGRRFFIRSVVTHQNEVVFTFGAYLPGFTTEPSHPAIDSDRITMALFLKDREGAISGESSSWGFGGGVSTIRMSFKNLPPDSEFSAIEIYQATVRATQFEFLEFTDADLTK